MEAARFLLTGSEEAPGPVAPPPDRAERVVDILSRRSGRDSEEADNPPPIQKELLEHSRQFLRVLNQQR